MDEYKTWIKSLELDIECPVCLDIPQTNTLLCVNGHHVCQSCHKAKKLEMCPVCFQDYTEAKNLFLEKFIGSLETLQETIENMIEKERQNVEKICHEYISQYKKEILQKAVKSVSTQTDPIKMTPPNRQNNQSSNNYKLKIHYPCIVGKCQQRLEYENLIHHLKDKHSEIFTEATINIGSTFFRKFSLCKEDLPKIYDFAFQIYYMGLFFFNVTIHTNGELIARVLFVNQNTPKEFSCEFAISCRNVLLKDHGVIKSRNPNREMMSNLQFQLSKEKMFHVKRNKMLECSLKITEVVFQRPASSHPIANMY